MWQDRERALARAREADAALARGTILGPLHGVPITIKEAFAYKGSPNTWGIAGLKDAISPRTAIAVERLEAAGAIVIGKTNVFLLPTTFTSAFPHDQSTPIENRVVETPEGKRPYLRDMATWIGFASVTGLPATVAPVGHTGAGLPAGIQIIAPMWEDATSIEFAALLSDVVEGFIAPTAFRE